MSEQENKKRKKSVACIFYHNERTNQNCLKGLTEDESKEFRRIVDKQFKKGIKIRITYKIISLKKLLATNVSGKNIKS